MKWCWNCDVHYPNYDDAGQPMDRCPACGIPFPDDEVTETYTEPITDTEYEVINDTTTTKD